MIWPFKKKSTSVAASEIAQKMIREVMTIDNWRWSPIHSSVIGGWRASHKTISDLSLIVTFEEEIFGKSFRLLIESKGEPVFNKVDSTYINGFAKQLLKEKRSHERVTREIKAWDNTQKIGRLLKQEE